MNKKQEITQHVYWVHNFFKEFMYERIKVRRGLFFKFFFSCTHAETGNIEIEKESTFVIGW